MSKEIPCPKCGHVWLWADWKKDKDAFCPKGHGCATEEKITMSDLVKRLRDMNGGWASDEALAAADRIEELEANLAKAVEVAEKSIKWLRLYGADVHREAATLAELTGGKDE